MAVKRSIPFTDGTYFITFTCYRWLQLIAVTNAYDLFYKWFDYLKGQGHHIVGFQLMPNHVHLIIAFRNTGRQINKTVGDGKRFVAYGIIERLKANEERQLLQQLEQGVNNSDRKRGKLHEVWEDSFDWKECRSTEMILQKLNYMHCNPCRGRWALVENPADYTHSSAAFYITGVQGIYPVTNFMDLLDIDLTK